jgi:hypothetical protein
MFDIFNKSGLDLGPLEDLVQEFMPFAQERHGFKNPPKLFLLGDEENAADPLGKTGGYNPGSMEITVYVSGRHPKDILRSLSHELVHHNQNERGDFSDTISTALGYAQDDPHMRDMEREAYEQGNLCLRDWEDGRKKQLQESIYYETIIGGENMSKKVPLKEWKDNEIHFRLMKKFGLIQEEGTAGDDIVVNERDVTEEKRTDENDNEEDEEEDSTGGLKRTTNESLNRLNNNITQLLKEQEARRPVERDPNPEGYFDPAAAAARRERQNRFTVPGTGLKDVLGTFGPSSRKQELDFARNMDRRRRGLSDFDPNAEVHTPHSFRVGKYSVTDTPSSKHAVSVPVQTQPGEPKAEFISFPEETTWAVPEPPPETDALERYAGPGADWYNRPKSRFVRQIYGGDQHGEPTPGLHDLWMGSTGQQGANIWMRPTTLGTTGRPSRNLPANPNTLDMGKIPVKDPRMLPHLDFTRTNPMVGYDRAIAPPRGPDTIRARRPEETIRPGFRVDPRSRARAFENRPPSQRRRPTYGDEFLGNLGTLAQIVAPELLIRYGPAMGAKVFGDMMKARRAGHTAFETSAAGNVLAGHRPGRVRVPFGENPSVAGRPHPSSGRALEDVATTAAERQFFDSRIGASGAQNVDVRHLDIPLPNVHPGNTMRYARGERLPPSHPEAFATRYGEDLGLVEDGWGGLSERGLKDVLPKYADDITEAAAAYDRAVARGAEGLGTKAELDEARNKIEAFARMAYTRWSDPTHHLRPGAGNRVFQGPVYDPMLGRLVSSKRLPPRRPFVAAGAGGLGVGGLSAYELYGPGYGTKPYDIGSPWGVAGSDDRIAAENAIRRGDIVDVSEFPYGWMERGAGTEGPVPEGGRPVGQYKDFIDPEGLLFPSARQEAVQKAAQEAAQAKAERDRYRALRRRGEPAIRFGRQPGLEGFYDPGTMSPKRDDDVDVYFDSYDPETESPKRDDPPGLFERTPYPWEDRTHINEALDLDEEHYTTLFESIKEMWTKDSEE